LYEKAAWLHQDTFAESEDLHLFETYWSNPPTTKKDKPRKRPKLNNNTVPSPMSDLAKSEQAPISDLANIINSSDIASVPLYIPSDHALTRDTANNDNRLPSSTVWTAPLTHATLSITNTNQNPLPTKPHVQVFHAHKCSLEFEQYKKTMGIDAAVYTAQLPVESAPEPTTIEIPDDFISLLTFPSNPDTISYNPIALHACSNKEDILTQSQMFKAEDTSKFIECQEAEIEGLQKFDVMDVCPISSLPPRAKLLSSIWSYRRKSLPNGILLKLKSRICVNGKGQAFGRDY
jgi:hypothetical protein